MIIDPVDYEYDGSKEVSCRFSGCDWSGTLDQCNARYVRNTSGYEMASQRWEYRCPRCGWLITAHYAMVS